MTFVHWRSGELAKVLTLSKKEDSARIIDPLDIYSSQAKKYRRQSSTDTNPRQKRYWRNFGFPIDREQEEVLRAGQISSLWVRNTFSTIFIRRYRLHERLLKGFEWNLMGNCEKIFIGYWNNTELYFVWTNFLAESTSLGVGSAKTMSPHKIYLFTN